MNAERTYELTHTHFYTLTLDLLTPSCSTNAQDLDSTAYLSSLAPSSWGWAQLLRGDLASRARSLQLKKDERLCGTRAVVAFKEFKNWLDAYGLH